MCCRTIICRAWRSRWPNPTALSGLTARRASFAISNAGRLDRAIEFLPSDDALAARAQEHQPLTRPELSVLLAYVKNTLAEDLLASDFPDDPQLEADLFGYFPPILRERF